MPDSTIRRRTLRRRPASAQATPSTRPFRVGYHWDDASWRELVGFLPRFMFLSSYDPGVAGSPSTTYASGERLSYAWLVLGGAGFVTLSTLRFAATRAHVYCRAAGLLAGCG